ncbi:MAG: HEAT repeat domain-containing protein [Patescibacteria group bacterium]|nr:HEAT repeat domain-containing protein [Patescibacteria group bacterium]
MSRANNKKSKVLFLLFLAFAMGATDAFFRWRRNYQSPASVMARCLRLWQSDETAKIGGLPVLIDQLDSQNPANRWAAAATLSRTGCQQAVPFLIQAMADDYGTGRTCVMAQSLGILSDRRAVPALIKALDHPSNEDLRVCASQALGRIGDTRAIEPLTKAFRSNRVSFSALKALGQIGTPQAESFLKSIVRNSPDSIDVVMAKDALKDIDIGKKRNDSSHLEALLYTARGQRRRWIVDLMARNGQIEVIEILTKLLANDNESAEIRGIAAAGLVLRGYDSFAALHKLAESQSSQARRLVQAAILRIETNTSTAEKSGQKYFNSFAELSGFDKIDDSIINAIGSTNE